MPLQTLEKYLPQIGLHGFVIMHDHVHLLLSPLVPLERAIQLVKGGFSFQAKRTLQWRGDIWQPGFTDHRIRDIDDGDHHIDYLFKSTQSARSEGRAIRGATGNLKLHSLPQWLKPQSSAAANGGAEAPPLQSRFGRGSMSAE
jgi:putative transposase